MSKSTELGATAVPHVGKAHAKGRRKTVWICVTAAVAAVSAGIVWFFRRGVR